MAHPMPSVDESSLIHPLYARPVESLIIDLDHIDSIEKFNRDKNSTRHHFCSIPQFISPQWKNG